MLVELGVTNLGLIEEAHLELCPGLNVLSGESGAGKTLCVEAVALLSGARATRESVGPFGERAVVEGRFLFTGGSEEEAELVVRRVIDASGRSKQYLNGSMVSVAELQKIVGPNVAVYRQFSAQALLDEANQLAALDAFAGAELEEVLSRYRETYARYKELERKLSRFANTERVEREIDFLRYQVAEIEAARVEPEEDERLAAELRLVEARESVRELCGEAARALEAAADSIATAVRPRSIDEAALAGELGELLRRGDSLAVEIRDLESEFRSLLERTESEPERVEALRERLDLLNTLKRKYGPTLGDVQRYLGEARDRLAELEGASEAKEQLEAEAAGVRVLLTRLAHELGEGRRKAAAALVGRVRDLLGALGMADCRFEIQVESVAGGGGADAAASSAAQLGPRGGDRVRYRFSASTKAEPKPLHKVASGGELARLMLALEVSIGNALGVGTLVFDEVDQGVGGRAAKAVGRMLHSLAETRQVLCVTHLAQVASFADAHFVAEKREGRVGVRSAQAEDRVAEISRMLGGEQGSEAAQRHALEILSSARGRKAS